MSKHKEKEAPYFVEVGDNGCFECGNNRSYDVIQPNGCALGVSYDNKDDADFLVEELNYAYEMGRLACKKEDK